MNYSHEYLLEVARSARFPYHETDGTEICDAKDGWKVRVFYTRGRFKYVDSLIAPDGEEIDSEEVVLNDSPEDDKYLTLLFWEPDESQFTDLERKTVNIEMSPEMAAKVEQYQKWYIQDTVRAVEDAQRAAMGLKPKAIDVQSEVIRDEPTSSA
jgi:hypothetical protein